MSVALIASVAACSSSSSKTSEANVAVGLGPTAGNLRYVKDGVLTAGLAIDLPVSVWTAVDAAARLREGGQPTASEQAGDVPEQFLQAEDITFYPTYGWSGFSDYMSRFAKLWLVP